MKDRLNLSIAQHGPVTYLPLREVASLVRREVVVDPEETYTEIGVRSFNKGTFHRRTVKGAEFTWQGLYRINQDDLIFSNIMAWEGAVALARPEDDGCLGNHRMLSCVCDPKKASARFLAYYFQSVEGRAKLVAASTGSIARNRTLTASALEQLEVPVPPLPIQVALANRLHLIEQKTAALIERLNAIESDAEKLLAIQFRQLIADAHYHPIGDVAPVIKRNVEIDLEKKYREGGARSFGKGLFVKPDFDGAEATWQKPVWIEEGDLVLSNIKAWEGAIAVAGSEHHRCIASHRYITCVPRQDLATARFLNYYLLSREGMDQVSLASPGTADRNRTLSLGSLAKIKVPVPPLKAQIRFNALQAKVGELKARHNVIREANAALVPAMLERIFESGRGDKLHK